MGMLRLITLSVLLVGCSDNDELLLQPSQINAMQQFYVKNCEVCHGIEGDPSLALAKPAIAEIRLHGSEWPNVYDGNDFREYMLAIHSPALNVPDELLHYVSLFEE